MQSDLPDPAAFPQRDDKWAKRVREVHEAYQASTRYLYKHRDELLDRYPGRWVAIVNGKVFGVEDDVVALIDQLGNQGVVDRAVVVLMTHEEPPRYLPPE